MRGEWDNPYLTLKPYFEARQIGAFGEMAKKGYIYKGLKPVYWCASCETALAEAEVEYDDKRSASIYVRFPVCNGRGVLPEKDTYVVIWTTTPWTLPANLAICLHPDYRYVLVRTDREQYLVAEELKDSFLELIGASNAEVTADFKGSELERVECGHPFVDRVSLVILGGHVTLEQGTGCVHTAPGHGMEDFIVGREYGLPVLSPVDARGRFTGEGGIFAGQFYLDANKAVLEELQRRGHLLHQATVQHQYPHCWRCKNPVFFRATEQWLPPLTDSARRPWRQSARCAGSRPGARSASTAWLPTGATGAFPASAAGECPSLFFTAKSAAKSSLMIKPSATSRNCSGNTAPMSGLPGRQANCCRPE